MARPFLRVVGAAYARAFGTVGRLAGQNALRNPRRTAATASALMIGLTLVTTMSVAGSSAGASVDRTVARSFLGHAPLDEPMELTGTIASRGDAPGVMWQPTLTRMLRIGPA